MPQTIYYSCLAPLNILKMCNNEGKSASIDSAAPLVEPGKASTKVFSLTPATLRDNIE